MKRSLLISLLLWPLLTGKLLAQCSALIPTGVKVTNLTNCSADVSWNPMADADYYMVRFQAAGSSIWSSSTAIAGTSYTVRDLLQNTPYSFEVASFCSDSTTQGFSLSVSKTTKKCSNPSSLSVSEVGANSARLNWEQVCNAGTFTLQYKKTAATQWTTVNNISGFSYSLTGLSTATAYEWKVKAVCGSMKSSYVVGEGFTTASVVNQRKNLVLIVLDDARYDVSTLNGAPSWFSTPAINRIAEEGVNFRVAIPATSQCSPSRATLYTGLYPHANGVTKNGAKLDEDYMLVQQVLSDHGYYTGFVGKYGQYLGQPEGFDWWATSEGDIFVDPEYKINGNDTLIPGHILDVYPQLALSFLNAVPEGQSFALFYFVREPHSPTTPRESDQALYSEEVLPFPSNFDFYDQGYPSYYTNFLWNAADTSAVNDLKLRTYQCLKATDENVDTILDWIEARNWLDSTLVIFTSDNGMLMGEHHMDGKVLALEESIRVPLFMRYPAWFAAHTEITDQIASNVDVATTILDFFGIENTFGFQGISLRALANGEISRQSILYQYPGDPLNSAIRMVRTLTGKFIKSYCTETTEEYYDLVNDPGENENQIFNPAYADTIERYRLLLDSLREAIDDHATLNTKTCELVIDQERFYESTIESDKENAVTVYPSPAASAFTIYFVNSNEEAAQLKILDQLGRIVLTADLGTDFFYDRINCEQWPTGTYYWLVQQETRSYSGKILISR